MDDTVVCERWPQVRLDVGHQVIVLSLSRYEADLGMRTRQQVHRQLAVDVPRCHVAVGGRRLHDGEEVWRAVRHARLCTQAVLAPVVEWVMRAGAVAHECDPKHRMEIHVSADGADLDIHKQLGVWADDGRSGTLGLHVHTDDAQDVVGVELDLAWR